MSKKEKIRDVDRDERKRIKRVWHKEGYKTVLLNQHFQEANQMHFPSSKILISHQPIGTPSDIRNPANNENKHDMHAQLRTLYR